MNSHLRLGLVSALIGVLGFGLGMWMQPPPPDPSVQIKQILVEPSLIEAGTKTNLHITTRFKNSGCRQTLVTRFLLNTKPAPSIALPERQGPSVLPMDQDVIVDDVILAFPLTEGTWHLYSVASCFLDGDPLPATAVAPIALFNISG